MDIGAHQQIDKFKEIAEKHGINVPRLRGYRLMRNEKPISQKEIDEIKKSYEVCIVQDLCDSDPFWDPTTNCSGFYENDVKKLCDYYLVKNPNKEEIDYEPYIAIRWDRIHGWKRRILKFEIKKQNRNIQKQFDVWNKYAGKENILYIHSRIGGANWEYYGVKYKIAEQEWYLEHVDDCYDNTYCDIYAKIREDNLNEEN